jgi:hypothetical protein
MMPPLVFTAPLRAIRRATDSTVARATLLVVVLLVSTWHFLDVVGGHYPIDQWLFWHYARVIGLAAVWTLACLSAGHRVLKLGWRRTLPISEHLTLSLAVGVLVFFLATFAGGTLGLFGPIFAGGLPLAMFAAGAPGAWRYARRAIRGLRRARRKPRMSASILSLPIGLFGLMGILMIYFFVLTPDSVSYDSRWYHLGLAEHYVAEGAVRPSPEGFFPAALPQLASLLYAWPLMLRTLPYFDRIELAAHIEFALFLATLAGIPVLVRAVLPRSRAPLAWAATFLFPGIFLYDSSLGVGADHVAAFWAVPIYITMLRALEDLAPRRCALFAAMLAGAALTKYQSLALMVAPLIAFAFRSAWLVAKAASRSAYGWRIFSGPASALVVGVVLTAPHWLKNWIYYGDPLYPFLYKHLQDHPWTADTAHRVEDFSVHQMAMPHGTLKEKLRETLVDGVLNFSFVHHDWPNFHGPAPIFGSLFTLLLAALPFLRKSGRTALLFLCANVGVFVWYWTSHQDRYLQVQVPWMASAVAAALILVWKSGIAARLACMPLVAAQIVWGGDFYFYPTEGFLGQPRIKMVTDLMSAHFRKDTQPLSPFGGWFDVGSSLPRGAKVLVHQSHIHLGLRAMSVSDWESWQGGLSYGRLGSPRAIYDELAGWGVTHVLWLGNRASDSLAGDLAFWQFVKLNAVDQKTFREGLTLARMPPAPPSGPFSDSVLVRVCGAGPYADGMYKLSDLTLGADVTDPKMAPAPRMRFDGVSSREQAQAALSEAGFLVLRRACDPTLASVVPASLQAIGARGELELLARRTER